MTKVTIGEVEYDTDNMNESQKRIVNLLNTGTYSMSMLEHMTQCVSAIQKVKINELNKSLEDNDD
jgi:hypothetical protein